MIYIRDELYALKLVVLNARNVSIIILNTIYKSRSEWKFIYVLSLVISHRTKDRV